MISLFILPSVFAAVQDNVEAGIFDINNGGIVNGVTVVSSDQFLNLCTIEYQLELGEIYEYDIYVDDDDFRIMPDGTTVRVVGVTFDGCELDIENFDGVIGDVIGVGTIVNGFEIFSVNDLAGSVIINYGGGDYNLNVGDFMVMPDGITVNIIEVGANDVRIEFGVDVVEEGDGGDGGEINDVFFGEEGDIVGVNIVGVNINDNLAREEVCLIEENGQCLFNEIRFEGDTNGLVSLAGGSAIRGILGPSPTRRRFLEELGEDPRLFDAASCMGAEVCSDREESSRLRCSPISNGVCPSDYGDWGEDGENCEENYFGGLCTPCDPDCDKNGDGDIDEEDNCGTGIEISNMPYGESNGIEVPATITCSIYGYEGDFDWDEGKFILQREVGEGDNLERFPIGESYVNCELLVDEETWSCTTQFEIRIGIEEDPVNTCETINFRCDFWYNNIGEGEDNYEFVGMAADEGMVGPSVTIIRPEEGAVIEGPEDEDTELIAEVSCIDGNIERFRFGVNYLDSFCKIHGSDQNIEGEYSFNWDGKSCTNPDGEDLNIINEEYILDAIATANSGRHSSEGQNSINITVDNPPPPPPEFNILNLVLAKIRTWV
tara:strand:+ start:841 stop:2649 length:1809 start_codon:yes stop_codon:yes gene_type:complete